MWRKAGGSGNDKGMWLCPDLLTSECCEAHRWMREGRSLRVAAHFSAVHFVKLCWSLLNYLNMILDNTLTPFLWNVLQFCKIPWWKADVALFRSPYQNIWQYQKNVCQWLTTFLTISSLGDFDDNGTLIIITITIIITTITKKLYLKFAETLQRSGRRSRAQA